MLHFIYWCGPGNTVGLPHTCTRRALTSTTCSVDSPWKLAHFFFPGEMYIYLYSGVNVKMTAGSAEQVKPGDLASGARRTENWYKETHVTTIKRGGGARKNTRVENTRSREHAKLDFLFLG